MVKRKTHKLRRSSPIIVISDKALLPCHLLFELLRLLVVGRTNEIERWEDERCGFGEAEISIGGALRLLELVYDARMVGAHGRVNSLIEVNRLIEAKRLVDQFGLWLPCHDEAV